MNDGAGLCAAAAVIGRYCSARGRGCGARLGCACAGATTGRGGRCDLAAVGIPDEGNGDFGRVADLLNEALLIGRIVKHILHLRDERLTCLVVGDQAEQAADLRHVTLSVDRWSPPRGSMHIVWHSNLHIILHESGAVKPEMHFSPVRRLLTGGLRRGIL